MGCGSIGFGTNRTSDTSATSVRGYSITLHTLQAVPQEVRSNAHIAFARAWRWVLPFVQAWQPAMFMQEWHTEC